MSWADFVRHYWPIAAFFTPFVMAGGFAWLKLQFPTRADLEKLRTDRETEVAEIWAEVEKEISVVSALARTTADKQIEQGERLRALASESDKEPSKHSLSKDIGKLAERVGAMEAGLKGLSGQLGTNNTYLQMLIEKTK